MQRLGLVALFCAVMMLASGAAHASLSVIEAQDVGTGIERYALVIGNGEYENVSVLDNPVNDARAMGEALSRVGFKVLRAEDADRREMQAAIEQFLLSVTPGSEALVFFAGHGVEVEGQNFLLPVDVPDLSPSQRYSLRSEGFSLDLLLADVQSRGARVNIVLLDACRNNPFSSDGTRSLGSTRGLGRLDPPQGTVVIYAAAAGELALDRLGPDDDNPNGLFTRNLLELIATPGLEVRPMVQELKERVYSAALDGANHIQRPSYYDGLIGRFYFLPPEAETAETHECELLVDVNAPRDRLLFLDTAAGLVACRQALAENPGRRSFETLLAAAEEQDTARRAILADDPVLGQAYLRLYPEGRYADDVRSHVASLGGDVPGPGPVVEPEIEPEPVERLPLLPDAPSLIPSEVATLSDRDVIVGVQRELNRLGCEAGSPDGIWGNKGRQALANLELNAGRPAASVAPTRALLSQLQSAQTRICPPCFTFNGKQYCE